MCNRAGSERETAQELGKVVSGRLLLRDLGKNDFRGVTEMNCHPYDVTKISQAGNVCNKKFENNEKLQNYANKNVRIPAMKNFCTMKTPCLERERGRGKIGSMKHIRNLDSDQNCFGNQISKVFFSLKKLKTRLSPNFGFCVSSLPPPPPKKKREFFRVANSNRSGNQNDF